MTLTQKISGYFKQFAGEVTGSQTLHDEGRRDVADDGYQEKEEQVVAVEPRIVSGAGRVVSAECGLETVIHADAVPQFAGAQAVTAGNLSAGFEETAPQQDRETGMTNYSDTEELKLYRLVPIASDRDGNWDQALNQGEVVVRARSSGDARVVAAEAELDYMEIDALPGDGNSTTSSSAFRNEKLYTVVAEGDPAFSAEGPRGVVEGNVRLDNIRPTEL